MAKEYKLRVYYERDWKDGFGMHLGINSIKGKKHRYQDARFQTARAMWNNVKRLTKLPPMAKCNRYSLYPDPHRGTGKGSGYPYVAVGVQGVEVGAREVRVPS